MRMLEKLFKNSNSFDLITYRSFRTFFTTNNQHKNSKLQQVINEDDDAVFKSITGSKPHQPVVSSTTTITNKVKTSNSKKRLIKVQSKETVDDAKLRPEDYVSNVKLQREENLKRLEQLRVEEKTQVFNKYLRLLKDYQINEYLVNNLSKIPLISDDLIQSDEINEFYDKEEYEWATKSLITHRNQNVLDEKMLNQTKWLYPSISAILSIGDEKKYQRLLEWKLKEMESTSFEGFIQKNAITKQKGVDFHNAIELTFKKQPLPTYESNIQASVDAIQKLIKEDFKHEFFLLESSVAHNKLAYHGRLDCLGYYKDQFCLIDWKRSDLPKEDKDSLFDYPVQLAAYLGAYLNDYNFKTIRKSHDIQGGLIINISEDGQTNVHSFNYQQMEYYWYKWISVYRNFLFQVLNYTKEKMIN